MSQKSQTIKTLGLFFNSLYITLLNFELHNCFAGYIWIVSCIAWLVTGVLEQKGFRMSWELDKYRKAREKDFFN